MRDNEDLKAADLRSMGKMYPGPYARAAAKDETPDDYLHVRLEGAQDRVVDVEGSPEHVAEVLDPYQVWVAGGRRLPEPLLYAIWAGDDHG